MQVMTLHELHAQLGAVFAELNGAEVAAHYGDPQAEQDRLRRSAGVLDLGFRSRLCLLGADRKSFLNGQVTNNVKDLAVGTGCHAALVTAKGKMQSDLFVYCLRDELLLDFEPGLSEPVQQRLEKYIIADDAQIVNVAEPYGLLSVQGPRAAEVIAALGFAEPAPSKPLAFLLHSDPTLGDLYVMNQARCGSAGFDLFVPSAALGAVFDKLVAAARAVGGGLAGWLALDQVRLEAGIPRFGADIDDTHLPPEAGLESRAIHYAKGCYIGQEVIARIRTYGQVAKALRGIQWPLDPARPLPKRGDHVFWGDKDIGVLTSVASAPTLGAGVAFAYLRREQNQVGAQLEVRTEQGSLPVSVVTVPFQPFPALG